MAICAGKAIAKLLSTAGVQKKQLESVIDEQRKGRTVDSDVSDENEDGKPGLNMLPTLPQRQCKASSDPADRA